MQPLQPVHATTIVAVRRGQQVALAGDGQVTVGEIKMKRQANKIRRLSSGTVLAGFAGSAADAFTLFERFESKLDEYHGSLVRAAVELAKDWRTDRVLRRLEALLLVADKQTTLIVSGSGEVIEPDDAVAAIGSGGGYALTAGRALLAHTDMTAPDIAREALCLAADVCIYTNREITVEVL